MTPIKKRAAGLHQPIVKSLAWPDELRTRQFAAALAARPEIGDCYVELRGELGAGKTTFVRYLLQALGVSGRIKSPTYAIVETYAVQRAGGSLSIAHFDFYRFADPREWEDAGFRELFAANGLKLAEWPENANRFLPLADLALTIEVQDDASRLVRTVANTPVGAAVLAAVLP